MKYLITHGLRNFGYNPGHTAKGLYQVGDLVRALPESISLAIVGTGRRFMEIFDQLVKFGGIPENTRRIFSPFCGSPDGVEADGKIITYRCIKILGENYEGMTRSPAFDAWKFVDTFAEKTLFCAGGELMIALGAKAINKKGCLYQINGREITLLREGTIIE